MYNSTNLTAESVNMENHSLGGIFMVRLHFPKAHYEYLVPQLGKGIYQMNAEEAAAYFETFTEKIPERVSYVSRICAKELRVPKSRLDCSPDSLLPLWKWFRRRAKTEPIPSAEAENSVRQLTPETEYILRDIGMYLGETLRKNLPGIYWTYHTEPCNDFFQNHPLLKGFVDRTTGTPCPVCFEPIHMARVQASKILTGKSGDEDLRKLYNIWAEKTELDTKTAFNRFLDGVNGNSEYFFAYNGHTIDIAFHFENTAKVYEVNIDGYGSDARHLCFSSVHALLEARVLDGKTIQELWDDLEETEDE